jgi:hypothetical protein
MVIHSNAFFGFSYPIYFYWGVAPCFLSANVGPALSECEGSDGLISVFRVIRNCLLCLFFFWLSSQFFNSGAFQSTGPFALAQRTWRAGPESLARLVSRLSYKC